MLVVSNIHASENCQPTEVVKITKPKAVKRKKQVIHKVVMVAERVQCTKCEPVIVEVKQDKNLIMLGARYDYVGIGSESLINNNGSSSKATLYSKKALVLDLLYFRRSILDSVPGLGLGIGIDTNATPRVTAGIEF